MLELQNAERAYLAGLTGLISETAGLGLATLAAAVTDGVIVEVGSHRGKSTCYLAAGSRAGGGARVYAIDLWTTGHNKHWNGAAIRADFNQQTEPYADLIEAIQGNSRAVVTDWSQPIGLLFVDAAHDYESALHDITRWGAFVVPGGAVAVDDCMQPAVRRAVADASSDGTFGSWRMVGGKLITGVRRA